MLLGKTILVRKVYTCGWSDYTGDVVSYDNKSKTITFDTYNFAVGWEQCKVSYGNGNSNYFLFGKLEFLDSEKEYYYDSDGKLYLYKSGNHTSNDSLVEYKARQYGIDLSKKNYINIEGINLFACTLKTSYSSHNIKINKLEAKYISHWSTIDCNSNSRDLDTGIMIVGNNNEIRNSVVEYSAGNGIVINGRNSKILNSYIHDCNYLGGYNSNVKLYGKNNIIGYNTLLRSGRGVLTGNFIGCKIIHNEIAYANILSSDGACIYLGGLDGGNSEIAYNYIHSHYGEERWGSGIYLDNNTLNFVIHHNFTDTMQLNGPRSHIVVANNTIIGRGIIADYWMPVYTNGVEREKYPNDGMGTFLFNNIIVPQNHINLKRGINPIIQSSNWVSSENGDPMLEINGTLSTDSPCVNYFGGKKIDYINDDVTDGKTYIGAFKYGVEPWKYGYDFSNNIECEYTDIDVSIMNRVKNSSFSTNNLDEWEPILNNNVTVITTYDNWWFNENLASRTGNNALVTNPGSGVQQVISGLMPNSTYTLTAWSRIEKDGNAEVSVKCGDETASVTGTYNSDLNWTLNTIKFKTGINDTAAMIYLKNTGFGSVNWDDIGIYLNYID